jgi:apolipoprotein N-acyltransferase
MMSRIFSFFKLNSGALGFGALSGFLVGTSYIPFPPWALLFCYTPLWIFSLTKARDWRQVFIAGWAAQFTLTLIGFHWIAYVAHVFGYMPWPLAILTLLIFAALMHLYIPLALCAAWALAKKLQLSQGAALLAMAATLSLFEQHWPSIFEWNMGYPLLWTGSALTQWSDVVGFLGLSFSVYLINAWASWLFLKKNLRLAMGTGLTLGLTLAALHWAGRERQKTWSQPESELKTLIVQANIGNAEKIQAEQGVGAQQFIADEFFALTHQGLAAHPETELVVWPESAFPDLLNSYALTRRYSSQFQAFARSIQKPILTGAFSKDAPGKAFRDDYNAVFLFDELGENSGDPYHKTRLLIFGEYIPFGRDFPWLAKLNPGGIGWGRGTGPTSLEFGDIGLGIQICYESLDPQFSSALVAKGAEILVNVTNDSWFGPSFEPHQHLYMTFARALETRRPLIRSTNTGISSVILADGTVLKKSPLFEKWYGLFSVKFQKNPPLTFYSRFGSWLSFVIFVFLLGTLALGRQRGRILRPGLERNS